MTFKNSKYIFILVLYLFIQTSCSPQKSDEIIASVEDIAITKDEFQRRFEFNPRLKQFKNIDEAKIKFLGSLVAEKLFSLEAEKLQLTPEKRNQAFIEQIGRESVIEEFYNQKISSQVDVSEIEIQEAYQNYNKTVEVVYTSFADRKRAEEFQTLVQSGKTFNQAYRLVSGVQVDKTSEIGKVDISWGKINPEIEDVVFKLKPGQLSKPIPVLGNFYVVKILSEKMEIPTATNFNDTKSAIEKILRKRKKKAAFVAYFKNMMQGKRTKVPPELFKFLVEHLETVFEIEKDKVNISRKENPSPINERELSLAQSEFVQDQNTRFVTFDDSSSWTVGEFLVRLSVGRFPLDFSSQENFRWSVRQQLITMIEQEYIFKKAVEEKIDQNSFVLDENQMWQENMNTQLYLQHLFAQDSTLELNQEQLYLSTQQISKMAEELLKLAKKYQIAIDEETLTQLDLKKSGVLLLKTHFPGRLAVPITIPLENLSPWQNYISHLMENK